MLASQTGLFRSCSFSYVNCRFSNYSPRASSLENITDNVIFVQIYEFWLAEVECYGGGNELFNDVAVRTKEKKKLAGFSRGRKQANSQGRRAHCVTLTWFQPLPAQCTHLFYCTLHSTITWLSCCRIRVSKLNSLSRLKPSVTVSFCVCLGCLPCGLKEVQARGALHQCHQLLITKGSGEESNSFHFGEKLRFFLCLHPPTPVALRLRCLEQ